MSIETAGLPDFGNRAVREINPHDRLMQRAWQNCRAGLAICQRDPLARQKALAFSERAKTVAPAHMQRWIEILNGKPQEHIQALFNTDNFLNLPPHERAWWDQLIQSAPFAPVLVKQRAKGKEQKAKNKKKIVDNKLI